MLFDFQLSCSEFSCCWCVQTALDSSHRSRRAHVVYVLLRHPVHVIHQPERKHVIWSCDHFPIF